MRMLRAIRGAWRRLFNRCELCGKPAARYSLYDVHTWERFCRPCNKRFLFGRLFGAGPQSLPMRKGVR